MSQYVVRLVLDTGINTFNTIEEYQDFVKTNVPSVRAMFNIIAENLAMGIMKEFNQVLDTPNTIKTTMVFANLADKQLYANDLTHEIRTDAVAFGMGMGWHTTVQESEEG